MTYTPGEENGLLPLTSDLLSDTGLLVEYFILNPITPHILLRCCFSWVASINEDAQILFTATTRNDILTVNISTIMKEKQQC